jgi:hypothetical protein
MKKLILSLFLLISLSAQASITLVSDLDDTIKITNSGQEVDGTINALFSKEVFTGMPEFLNAAKMYVDEIHVLSASPTFLRYFIEKTFQKKEIEVDSLILRDLLRRQSKIEYKVKELKRLFEENSADDFILVGDDVGQDPEAYDEIQRLYPNRVLASYIHVINGRDIPRSSIRYWTSFDLVLREYLAGRMADSNVNESIEKLLSETKMKLIFPNFAQCPKTPAVYMWQLRTAFAREATQVMKKLNWYCLSMHSNILLP